MKSTTSSVETEQSRLPPMPSSEESWLMMPSPPFLKAPVRCDCAKGTAHVYLSPCFSANQSFYTGKNIAAAHALVGAEGLSDVHFNRFLKHSRERSGRSG